MLRFEIGNRLKSNCGIAPLGDIVPCHSHRVIEVYINNFMLRIGAPFESNTSAEYTTAAAALDRVAL